MRTVIKLLIVSILLCPSVLFAQGTYKPGYLVTLQGDTLKGELKLNQSENIDRFTFKKQGENTTKLFTVKDVKYFNVDNIISYLRYQGPVTTGNTDISKLLSVRDTSIKQVEVFLQVEQEGQSVNLYSYADDIKTRYFIKEADQQLPTELIYRTYLVNNSIRPKNEDIYKLQLLNIANKYIKNDERLANIIDESTYNINSIKPIITLLNKNVVNKNKKRGRYISFFAGAGFGLTRFDVSGASFNFYNAKSGTSVFPKIQAGFELYTNPIISKLVIRAEVSVTKNKYDTDIDLYNDGRAGSRSTYGFGQVDVSTALLFLYNVYYTDPLKVYFGGGVSVNFAKYTGNVYVNNYTGQQNSLQLFGSRLGFPIRAGAIINKKIDTFVNYTLPGAMSSSNIKQSNIQVGLNYFFN